MSIKNELLAYLDSHQRDTGYEKLLLKTLKKLPQEERYSLIKPHIHNSHKALIITKKLSLTSDVYREIWKNGLIHPNVSSIKWLVEVIAANLGWYKTFSLFQDEIKKNNSNISSAIYHSLYLFDKIKPNEKAHFKFIKLVHEAEKNNLLDFKPELVWGSNWRT